MICYSEAGFALSNICFLSFRTSFSTFYFLFAPFNNYPINHLLIELYACFLIISFSNLPDTYKELLFLTLS